jgi:molybdate transport system substrate-binding protein
MAQAVDRGLVLNPRDAAGNRLIVALPPGNPAHIAALSDLGRSGVRLVLADKSVPAGNYAEQALRAAEANGDASHGFAAAAVANVVSRETDVEAVVAKVATGVADAGIVYATDAAADHRITALAIPTADQPATVYPVARTTRAHNPSGAMDFVAFLLSSSGQQILRDAGFSTPPQPPTSTQGSVPPAGAGATPSPTP